MDKLLNSASHAPARPPRPAPQAEPASGQVQAIQAAEDDLALHRLISHGLSISKGLPRLESAWSSRAADPESLWTQSRESLIRSWPAAKDGRLAKLIPARSNPGGGPPDGRS